MKLFLMVYPTKENFDNELGRRYGLDISLQQKAVVRFNEFLQIRYRDKGYKIGYIVPEGDLPEDIKTVSSKINFHPEDYRFVNYIEGEYSDFDLGKLAAQFIKTEEPIDECVFGGFHLWGDICVWKVLEIARKLGIEHSLDRDLTDRFFNEFGKYEIRDFLEGVDNLGVPMARISVNKS